MQFIVCLLQVGVLVEPHVTAFINGSTVYDVLL